MGASPSQGSRTAAWPRVLLRAGVALALFTIVGCNDGGDDAEAWTISGNVVLSGESTHSGVKVELWGTTRTAVTDASGAYAFPSVSPGTYHVVASKARWTVDQRSYVKVAGDTTVPPLKLRTTPAGIKAAALVYDALRKDLLWIATDDPQVASMLADFPNYHLWWIGGIARHDDALEHHFTFDPSTIFMAFATIEAIQLYIEYIREHIATLKDQVWVIPGDFLAVKQF